MSDFPHPGSYAHLRSMENYIMYIVRRPCFHTNQASNVLGILGFCGLDLFENKIEEPFRQCLWECRTRKDVQEFYSTVRGSHDLPFRYCPHTPHTRWPVNAHER